ncbi:MerR family transcriptional regulator [Streptomyces sp. NPDC049887]|uniref:MerR family transcriptional regulator n=1 Tax=Streptomyces sp. NPDC049887 TaxID=3155654 RepID=UPI0034329148
MKRKQRKQEQEPLGELMTVEEVARYFGVKPRRVRGWEKRRVLTPVLRRGERVYMTVEVEHLAALYAD